MTYVIMLADFVAWKEKYEISSCSSFVKATSNKGADKYTIYYYCSRSAWVLHKEGPRETSHKIQRNNKDDYLLYIYCSYCCIQDEKE